MSTNTKANSKRARGNDVTVHTGAGCADGTASVRERLSRAEMLIQLVSTRRQASNANVTLLSRTDVAVVAAVARAVNQQHQHSAQAPALPPLTAVSQKKRDVGANTEEATRPCQDGVTMSAAQPVLLSAAMVSEYLERLVRDIVGQMRGSNSAKHYDRHVLLVDELLLGDGALGFTPAMVLAGLGDVLEIYAAALMHGDLLVPSGAPQVEYSSDPDLAPHVAAAIATSHSSFGKQQHHQNTLTFPSQSGSPGMFAAAQLNGSVRVAPQTTLNGKGAGLLSPVEGFLPPLVQQARVLNADGTEVSAMEAYNAVQHQYQQQQLQQQAATNFMSSYFNDITVSPPGTAGAVAATQVLRNQFRLGTLSSLAHGNTIPTSQQQQQTICTVPEALHALLMQCGKPLICLTMDDQRDLPEAIHVLCGVMSRIVHLVNPPGGPSSQASPLPAGVTPYQYACMMRHVRIAALKAMESLLAPFDSESEEVKVVVAKSKQASSPVSTSISSSTCPTLTKKKHINSNKSTQGSVKGAEEVTQDTLTAATVRAMEVHKLGAVDSLVVHWEAVLEGGVSAGAESAKHGDTDGTLNDTHMTTATVLEGGGLGTEMRLFDSARNINNITAEYIQAVMMEVNGEANEEAKEEEEEARHRRFTAEFTDNVQPDTPPYAQRERTVRVNAETPGGEGVHTRTNSIRTRLSSDRKADGAPNASAGVRDPMEEADDSMYARRRGVMTGVEEEEVCSILQVLLHVLAVIRQQQEDEDRAKTLASTPNTRKSPVKGHSKTAQQQKQQQGEEEGLGRVAVLVLRTFARCALGDVCASLCLDLLWSLMKVAPVVTTRAILYDTNAPSTSSSPTSAIETATENLFCVLVSQLNASHRQHQREVRNDITVLLAALLRYDTQTTNQYDYTAVEGRQAYKPLPSTTVDAVNAIMLVLFDLLCGPELNVTSDGFEFTDSHRNSVSKANEDSVVTTTMTGKVPLLTRKTLRQYALRYHGVASPTLRKDNLQFKRLGWQVLELFCEWQAAHLHLENALCSVAKHEGVAGVEPPYEGYYLVDLCRLGFIDVLLLYVDTNCDYTAVVSWSREELVSLQGECWCLLTALVQSAQFARARYGAAAAGGLRPPSASHLAACSPSFQMGEGEAVVTDTLSPHHVDAQGDMVDRGLNKGVAATAVVEDETGTVVVNIDDEDDAEQGGNADGHALKDDDDDMFLGADVHILAAGGVETALRYLHDAPPSVESTKHRALVLLSTIARSSAGASGSNSVASMLARTPGLIYLLVKLLRNLRRAGLGSTCVEKDLHVTGGLCEEEEEKGDEEEDVHNAIHESGSDNFFHHKGLMQRTGYATGAFHLTASTMMLALECLSFLKSIGEVAQAAAMSRDGCSMKIDSTRSDHPVTGHGDGEENGKASDAAHAAVRPLMLSAGARLQSSATHRNVLELLYNFAEVGGVTVLVDWLQQVLQTSPADAATIVASNAAMTSATQTTASRALIVQVAASRAPPLSEADLYYHHDLIVAILDAIRALVIGCDANESLFVLGDGVNTLLNTVEALATAAHLVPQLPNERQHASDPSVILRDNTVTRVAYRGSGMAIIEERRAAFEQSLQYALSILADLLHRSEPACQQFLQWRSRRLDKKLHVTNGAPTDVDGVNGFLNAPQLLIALWASDMRAIEMREAQRGLWEPQQLLSGLELLHVHTRHIVRSCCRREYVRRLLRRKAQTIVAATAGSESVDKGASPAASAITDAEMVHYFCYLYPTDENSDSIVEEMAALSQAAVEARVAAMTSDEKARAIAIVQEVMAEGSDVDEDDGSRMDLVCATVFEEMSLAIKVYSCLASIGFDIFVTDLNSGAAISLSSAERSHVTAMAALPALCMDEICVGMAEAAEVVDVSMTSQRLNAASGITAGSHHHHLTPAKKSSRRNISNVGMRPISPDFRCLSGVLNDVSTRSHEIQQLMALGHQLESIQQQQLFDRFLVTRLRQPEGTHHLVRGMWKSTGRGRYLYQQQQQQPSVVVALSPNATASTKISSAKSHSQRYLSRASVTAATAAAGAFGSDAVGTVWGVNNNAPTQPSPAALAKSLSRRFESAQRQEEDTRFTVSHTGTIASDFITTPVTPVGGPAVSALPQNASNAGAAAAAAASTIAASAKGSQQQQQHMRPKRPQMTLTEKRNKKNAMIRNSLKKLPQQNTGTEGSQPILFDEFETAEERERTVATVSAGIAEALAAELLPFSEKSILWDQ